MYTATMGYSQDNDGAHRAEVSRDDICYQYRDELCRYIRATFGAGPPDPEDIVQTAFARFVAQENLHEINNPRAWLYAVARNLVYDYRRNDERGKACANELKLAHDAADVDDVSPERVVMERQHLKLILKTLEKMPRRRSRMVLLNRLDGVSASEIGRRLGISEAAVRKQIGKALNSCIKALSGVTNDDR